MVAHTVEPHADGPVGLPCPSCGRAVMLSGPSRPPEAPFCSSRCRTLDIGRWVDGAYRIAGRDGEAAALIEDDGDRT